jgi:hypothetical protein
MRPARLSCAGEKRTEKWAPVLAHAPSRAFFVVDVKIPLKPFFLLFLEWQYCSSRKSQPHLNCIDGATPSSRFENPARREIWQMQGCIISALVHLGRAATPDHAIGSAAQVGIDVVYEWGDVRIIGETIHDGISSGAAGKHGGAKFLDRHGGFDEGGTKTTADAVWPVAMVAYGIVAAEAVIRTLIDLPVDNLVGPRHVLIR